MPRKIPETVFGQVDIRGRDESLGSSLVIRACPATDKVYLFIRQAGSDKLVPDTSFCMTYFDFHSRTEAQNARIISTLFPGFDEQKVDLAAIISGLEFQIREKIRRLDIGD